MRFPLMMFTLLGGAVMPSIANATAPSDSSVTRVAVARVDSSHHIVVLRTGPWDVPRTLGGYNEMIHDMTTEPAQQEFTWPVTGWVRGVRLRVVGENGADLSRGLIHHLNVVNFGRRQLFYAIPERIVAVGRETEEIRLPATVGVPVSAGMPMAINFAWFNEAPEELHGVTIEVVLEWSPSNTVPRPVNVLPVHLGVVNPVASDPSFDLPAGTSSWSAEYTVPINGRIIAAGGHQHDFGTGIALDDISGDRPRNVLRIASTLDTAGLLVAMQRLLPGLTGDGIKLAAARRLRVTGTYDNRTGTTLVKGAMVHLAVLFAPARIEDWPAINAEDPDWKKDVADLSTPHGGMVMAHH